MTLLTTATEMQCRHNSYRGKGVDYQFHICAMKQGSRSQSPKRPKSGQGAGSKKLECEKDELAKKLQSISQRLSEIQSEKRKLSPLSRPSTAPKKETSEKKTKPHKREFFHPKLEFIMAEAAYSPYLTPPTASYGKKTLHYPFKMKEIRFQGRDPIPEEGFPVDIDFAKRRFVKEIINFKPRFEVTNSFSSYSY